MQPVVWSTFSVDTSAMLLAQSLDALFTSSEVEEYPEDFEGEDEGHEIFEAICDTENPVIFYGAVSVPDWIHDRNLFLQDRIFNSPEIAREFLRKHRVMSRLTEMGRQALSYTTLRDGINYTRARESLGSRSIDVVSKGNLRVMGTATNASEFNRLTRLDNARYITRHLDRVGKYRVFVGIPSIIENGIVGMSFSEKRMLSYKETLQLNQSNEAKVAIENLFSQGLIREEQGNGIEAWSETSHLPPSSVPEEILGFVQPIVNSFVEAYEPDFCAIDIIKTTQGDIAISNATTSPSLQENEVLAFVSDYFKNLITLGRRVTRDSFLRMAQNFSDEQAAAIVNLIRREGISSCSV